MDDAHVFGPEFHVLTFHEAISAKPEPLLTDYQVVVIGVTDREAKAWAERATLVRTAEGLSTDARTLAAQIGLAKAMRKYDLRKLITFHSSVAKAARFVDATRRDSLPGVIAHLTRSARPSGKLWTKHISGHTPAGTYCERHGASHRCRGVDFPGETPAASAVPLTTCRRTREASSPTVPAWAKGSIFRCSTAWRSSTPSGRRWTSSRRSAE